MATYAVVKYCNKLKFPGNNPETKILLIRYGDAFIFLGPSSTACVTQCVWVMGSMALYIAYRHGTSFDGEHRAVKALHLEHVIMFDFDYSNCSEDRKQRTARVIQKREKKNLRG